MYVWDLTTLERKNIRKAKLEPIGNQFSTIVPYSLDAKTVERLAEKLKGQYASATHFELSRPEVAGDFFLITAKFYKLR